MAGFIHPALVAAAVMSSVTLAKVVAVASCETDEVQASCKSTAPATDVEHETEEDEVQLLQRKGDWQQQTGTAVELGGDINIWFGYVKEERVCFRDGDLASLVGDEGSGSTELLLKADLVVLLQLAHRPSAEDMAVDGADIDFAMESCESLGGIGLDAQMAAKLSGRGMELVQLRQYAEDDPEEPDQSLLSIWYSPKVVVPGHGLAYKNKFQANSTACTAVRPAKTGPINVSYDVPVSLCPEASAWPEYDSSKASLAISWKPLRGGLPFAILGVNSPSSYFKGKNEMLQRTMTDIESTLHVSDGRVFILGDMNTRFLVDAWDLM